MPLSHILDGKGLDPAELAVIEPFCIGYHGAIRRGQIGENDRVIVIGAGSIGTMAAIAAKNAGARVYVADVSQKKIDYAVQNFGFEGGIYVGGGNFKEQCLSMTEGNGFDVSVEAVGVPSSFQNAIDAAAYGGKVIVIGIGRKNLDFNYTLLQKKELNVFGSRNALTEDFEHLIDLVKSGAVDIKKVITNTYSFDEAPRAFSEFAAHSADMLKVEIDFTA